MLQVDHLQIQALLLTLSSSTKVTRYKISRRLKEKDSGWSFEQGVDSIYSLYFPFQVSSSPKMTQDTSERLKGIMD